MEHSGQQKRPLAWHLEHLMVFTFESPPSDSYISSIKVKLNAPPSLTKPVPLHPEHAIILRSPHLLHIPRELHIQGVAHTTSKKWNYIERYIITKIVSAQQWMLCIFHYRPKSDWILLHRRMPVCHQPGCKSKLKKKIQLAIHQHSANNGEVKIFKNFYPQSLSPVFCVICMLHCVCVLLMQQNTHSKRIDVLSAKINFSPFISTTVLCDSDHRQIQGARSVLLSRTTSLVWKQVAQSFLICEWFA